MTEELNILILSCGSRNKIVQYFKKELMGRGQVLATDCSELAPALYDADKHFIVPRIDEEGYLDIILKICKENKVKGILSLIDPELSLLAKNKDKFLEVGTTPIISNYDLVEMSFDKFQFNEFLADKGFKSIRSYLDKRMFFKDLEAGIIEYPVFVKPVKGSASINISKVNTSIDIKHLFEKNNNLMIQEFMDGIEYGVDVYIDTVSGEPTAIFIKEKIKMRAGETDKSISKKDDALSDLIYNFVKQAGYEGIIDIDVFKVNDEYYISEVNPRFGGGYPHAHECGVNIPKMIINNLNNSENISEINNYPEDTFMLKYNEVSLLKMS